MPQELPDKHPYAQVEENQHLMQYDVLITEGAERDLEEIYDYIAEFDSLFNADYVLDQLMD